jgi:8-oxo-dGTP pyrophosphatase MutT (NUDIX family)
VTETTVLAASGDRPSTGSNAALATRGHVVLMLDDGRLLFLRELLGGSVSYVAPGVTGVAGETPGQTARRAALERLGIDVEIADLVFADTENGAEHFYFLARPLTSFEPVWETSPAPTKSGSTLTTLKRSALLAYPIRPYGIALRLRVDSVLTV